MLKSMVIVIFILVTWTSCATAAARNLNTATRDSADASFAFDAATRNFTEAVNDFSTAVIRFEFAVRTLAAAETDIDAVSTRDIAFHANREVRRAREAATIANDIAVQALNDSVQAGLDFNRAQHDLLVSSDPWGNNTSVRNTSSRAHNISVNVHNSALTQYQASRNRFTSITSSYVTNLGTHLAALQAHGLQSFPDELLPVFIIALATVGLDDVAGMSDVEVAQEVNDVFFALVEVFYATGA